MGGWMEMEYRKKWVKTFQFSFCKWLIHSSDYPWKINPVGSYSQQDLTYKYHYSQPHGENQLQPAATFMLSRLYKLYTGVRNCTLSKNTAPISYHPLQQHCLGVAFLFKLASQEVKQTFFQWRFKVCALNSSLLTTNFLYAFHRDLQNAGKKGKKKPQPETFSNSHYTNFYTLDSRHWVTIYPNYQVTLFTGREGHFHHNTFNNFTLILLRNNHSIVNSGLRSSFSNAF